MLGFCTKEQHRGPWRSVPVSRSEIVDGGIRLLKYWLRGGPGRARSGASRPRIEYPSWKLPAPPASSPQALVKGRPRVPELQSRNTRLARDADDKKRARLELPLATCWTRSSTRRQREKVEPVAAGRSRLRRRGPDEAPLDEEPLAPGRARRVRRRAASPRGGRPRPAPPLKCMHTQPISPPQSSRTNSNHSRAQASTQADPLRTPRSTSPTSWRGELKLRMPRASPCFCSLLVGTYSTMYAPRWLR